MDTKKKKGKQFNFLHFLIISILHASLSWAISVARSFPFCLSLSLFVPLYIECVECAAISGINLTRTLTGYCYASCSASHAASGAAVYVIKRCILFRAMLFNQLPVIGRASVCVCPSATLVGNVCCTLLPQQPLNLLCVIKKNYNLMLCK